MTLKEKLQNANAIKYEDNINTFDYIYMVQQRSKHSSGYHLMKIYGSIIDKETKEEKFYKLSGCSDVIDFDDVRSEFEWFCSIDIPEYNCLRFFARRNHKFYIEYFNLSSFKISIKY